MSNNALKTTTYSPNNVVTGYFIDRDNHFTRRAILSQDGSLTDPDSGCKVRDVTKRVEKSVIELDTNTYLIVDNGKKRSGLYILSPIPVLEGNMDRYIYNGHECLWVNKSTRIKEAYDVIPDKIATQDSMLLVKVKYYGADSLRIHTKWIKEASAQYVRICSSITQKSGVIWALIPHNGVNEDLLF